MTAPTSGGASGATRIRAVIVDDEPLAREVLRSMLADHEDVEIVGEAGDGNAALVLIERTAPDLVFLDVQMPERDGFAVLRELDPDRFPAVVFVTAYDQYALRAFEVHALDYLLKPFDEERLARTLARARAHLARGRASVPAEAADEAAQRILRVLDELGVARQHLERLVVREDERVFFVRVADVDWFEAAGKYITIHAGKQRHQIREAMGKLEQQLDPRRFTRVSRFAIVNVERIRELQPWFQGEYVVILHDGSRVATTRGYRENVNALLGK
jgi:two-component system LytT family response regulator